MQMDGAVGDDSTIDSSGRQVVNLVERMNSVLAEGTFAGNVLSQSKIRPFRKHSIFGVEGII